MLGGGLYNFLVVLERCQSGRLGQTRNLLFLLAGNRGFKSHPLRMKVKVGIVGASGYTGAELIRILLRHRFVELVFLSSRTLVGQPVNKVFPEFPQLKMNFVSTEEISQIVTSNDVDVVFLALPHDAAVEYAKIFYSKSIKVIDLSAAYRFRDKKIFEEVYKIHHPYDDVIKESVWGLTELFRDEIKKSKVIGNPGCYPTSISLGLAPLREIKDKIDLNDIVIDSKSGISGKGKKVSEDSLFVEHNENFYAYGLPYHRHTPEIEQFIKLNFGIETKVTFVPHVVPMDRGIFSAIYLRAEGVNEKKVFDIYRSWYDKELFIHVVDEVPQTKWVSNTNNCMISVRYIERTGRLVVFSVIDNLVKGASGQAVQNMNVMFGIDEREGLAY